MVVGSGGVVFRCGLIWCVVFVWLRGVGLLVFFLCVWDVVQAECMVYLIGPLQEI